MLKNLLPKLSLTALTLMWSLCASSNSYDDCHIAIVFEDGGSYVSYEMALNSCSALNKAFEEDRKAGPLIRLVDEQYALNIGGTVRAANNGWHNLTEIELKTAHELHKERGSLFSFTFGTPLPEVEVPSSNAASHLDKYGSPLLHSVIYGDNKTYLKGTMKKEQFFAFKRLVARKGYDVVIGSDRGANDILVY